MIFSSFLHFFRLDASLKIKWEYVVKNNLRAYHELLLQSYKQLADLSNTVQQCYSAFFEKLHDAVFITDKKGCFIYFNKAAEKLTGYEREQVMGRHFRLLFTLDDLNDGFLFFYQTMQGCYSEHTRFRIRRQDGTTRVVDVLASPVWFDRRVRAALAIARDVSGKSSNASSELERVRIFKKFSDDLDEWNKKNDLLKTEVQKILKRLGRRPSSRTSE